MEQDVKGESESALYTQGSIWSHLSLYLITELVISSLRGSQKSCKGSRRVQVSVSDQKHNTISWYLDSDLNKQNKHAVVMFCNCHIKLKEKGIVFLKIRNIEVQSYINIQLLKS